MTDHADGEFTVTLDGRPEIVLRRFAGFERAHGTSAAAPLGILDDLAARSGVRNRVLSDES